MTDWIPCKITIGGTVPAGRLDYFVACAEDDGAGLDWGAGGLKRADLERQLADHPGEPLILLAHQAYGGQLDRLTAFCERHGLTYRTKMDARPEYDAELVYWEPGAERAWRFDSNEAEQLLVSLDTLRGTLERGVTLGEVVATLERNGGPRVLPAFAVDWSDTAVPPPDPDEQPWVCPYCGRRNTNLHDPPLGYECHDCGRTYTVPVEAPSNA